jgi:hypothetical protein
MSRERQALIARLLEKRGLSGSATGIPRRRGSGPAPLSFGQERLWFLDQLAPGNPFYNDGTGFRLHGRLDVEALNGAVQAIIAHHDVLRTCFPNVGDGPVQEVADTLTVPLAVEDIANLPSEEREAELHRLATALVLAPFDLTRRPLVRVRLVRLAEDEHVLLLVMHHICFDGWSLSVFARELAEAYTAAIEGREPALPELPIQYADFAVWQRERVTGELLERQLGYWKETLAGHLTVLDLPTDRPRPDVPTFRGGVSTLVVPGPLTRAVKALGQAEGATLFATLLAAYQALLGWQAGQDEVLVGTPIAGRNHADLESLIGFFVNTLVLRTDLSGDPTFRELLRRAHEASVGASVNQDVPFERVVEELKPERKLSQNPLFQVWFTLLNTPLPEVELPGLSLSYVDVDLKTARLDLALLMWESGRQVHGRIEYNLDLFDASAVERFVLLFQELLRVVVSRPEARLSAVFAELAESESQRLASARARSRRARGNRLQAIRRRGVRRPGR